MRQKVLIAVFALIFGVMPIAAWALSEKDVQDIVKKYLTENPQIIVDSLSKYQTEQIKAASADAEKTLADSQDWLFKGYHPETGPKDGVAIVEFLDYNCGYCKKVQPEILELMKKEKDVRVIFVETPILGDSSVEAAKWALAANKQGKYLEFHNALMEHNGPKDTAVLTTIAERVGLNVADLKAVKDSDEIKKMLDDNNKKGQALGLSGTPAFITKAEVIGGYTDLAGLQAAMKKARDKK